MIYLNALLIHQGGRYGRPHRRTLHSRRGNEEGWREKKNTTLYATLRNCTTSVKRGRVCLVRSVSANPARFRRCAQRHMRRATSSATTHAVEAASTDCATVASGGRFERVRDIRINLFQKDYWTCLDDFKRILLNEAINFEWYRKTNKLWLNEDNVKNYAFFFMLDESA